MGDLLPHDPQAEECIIGLALLRADKINEAIDLGLTPGDFYHPLLKGIWAGVLQLIEVKDQIDNVTLNHHLQRTNPSLCAGKNIPSLLIGFEAAPPTMNIKSFVEIVLDLSFRRKVIGKAEEVARAAHSASDTNRLLVEMESLISVSPDKTHDTYLPWDLIPFYEAACHAPPIPKPAILGRRLDGIKIINPGMKGLIIAPPESGKSFLCVGLSIEAAMMNRHVLYIDYETAPDRMMTRVTSHTNGLLTDGWLTYIRPRAQAFSTVARRRLVKFLEEREPALVIIDGYNSMLAQNSVNLNEANEINLFIERLVNHLTGPDICTITIDHVPKNTSGPTRSITAMGSIAKTADADYILTMEPDAESPFKRFAIGHASIKVVKDREGVLRHKANKEDVVGRLTVRSHADGSWEHCIDVPPGHEGPGLPW